MKDVLKILEESAKIMCAMHQTSIDCDPKFKESKIISETNEGLFEISVRKITKEQAIAIGKEREMANPNTGAGPEEAMESYKAKEKSSKDITK